YSNDQLDIRGRDPDCVGLGPEYERRGGGHDPRACTPPGFCGPPASARAGPPLRPPPPLVGLPSAHQLSTPPGRQEHRSAGVTLALKNMSHGMNNNVCRSHTAGIAHGFGEHARVLGPNQCNTFIPQAVAQHRLRQKATLHILDGLIGVYEGGPGCWNRTW